MTIKPCHFYATPFYIPYVSVLCNGGTVKFTLSDLQIMKTHSRFVSLVSFPVNWCSVRPWSNEPDVTRSQLYL